ncbi:hypothetical protein [Longimicrobium sp.]|uniref:hypothetical protein n=1 Tax=Longimicrobium sp. TaxID=2029185 RepID=UPI002E328CF9|nr:hypothetical protein [Longimicrobium sp.]HEX6040095.1 hypothetical protein [Longimicrobium sp.]
MLKRYGVCLAAAATLLGACADLEVPTNPNSPPVPSGDPTPTQIEGLIGGTFRNFYYATHSESGIALAMSVAADEHTSSAANFAMIDFYQEPRRQIDNFVYYSNSPVLDYTWNRLYLTLSGARSGLIPMKRATNPVNLGANRVRAEAWARFMQGLATGMVALIYDRGYRMDETTSSDQSPELLSHDEMLALSMQYLDQAIVLASGNTFTIPAEWAPSQSPITSAYLARLAHSYKARFMAWEARTPAERQALNWNNIMAEVAAGVTSNFVLVIDDVNYSNGLGNYISPGWGWWDLRYAGMAETTGTRYQTWWNTPVGARQPFRFGSVDARFPSSDTASTSSAKAFGKYVYFNGAAGGNPERGTYNWSEYADWRWSDYWEASDIPFDELTVTEMRLLRAEGLFRTGDLAGAAAIINETRVDNGELPPATAAGIPNDPATCVPQLGNGQCGSLFEALKWEKRVEIYGTTLGDWYFDSRGWGDLTEGTPIQFPIPPRESAGLGLVPYTFGGVGGNCAAGSTCVPVS